MVKVLLLSFEQCFGPFTISLVEGSSETGLFSYLFNDFFRSWGILKYITFEDHHFYGKKSKLNSKFRKCKKEFRKKFSFLR